MPRPPRPKAGRPRRSRRFHPVFSVQRCSDTPLPGRSWRYTAPVRNNYFTGCPRTTPLRMQETPDLPEAPPSLCDSYKSGTSAAKQFAEKVRNLSFRTSAVFAEVRNLLCFQQEQIPHFVRDDSFSSFSANCKAVDFA